MIYFVSISGKMHWAVIKGNATETRQKKFLDKLPATVKDELGIYKNRPKRIVALRTHEKIYSNDAKHRWGNVNKIYPTTAEWLAYSLQT